MVQIYIQPAWKSHNSGDKSTPEWAILELQGGLESKEGNLSDSFVGDLHYTTKGIPVLIIGHHILYGKILQMEKPLAVLEKKSCSDGTNTRTTYDVIAVVRRKIIFKTRPKPIINYVPKK